MRWKEDLVELLNTQISEHAPNLDEGSSVSSRILEVLTMLFSSFIANSWERFVMPTKQL
jgi:hypothetical protein